MTLGNWSSDEDSTILEVMAYYDTLKNAIASEIQSGYFYF